VDKRKQSFFSSRLLQLREFRFIIYYLFFILSLIPIEVFSTSTTSVTDLKKEYLKLTPDTVKFRQVKLLAKYYESINHDSAVYWYKTAIDLSQRINKKSLGQGYFLLSEYYLNKAMRDSSAFFSEKALKLFEEENLSGEIFNCIEQLSANYIDLGEYNKAIDLKLKKLELSKNLKLQAKIGQAYHDLGYLYFFMGEYYMSLRNYLEAMDVFQKEKLDYEYFVSKYYCSLLYFEIGDYENCEKLLQESLVFFKKYEKNQGEDALSYSSTIYKRLALLDIEKGSYDRGINYCDSAFTLLKDGSSIGWVYAHLGVIYTKMNNYPKAKENFDLSKKYMPLCDHCYWPIYTDISEYFLHFNMVDSAIYYCNKTLERAVTYRYDIRILRTYKVMAKAYEAKCDYAQAYLYSEKYNDLYDKALNKRKLAMLKNAEQERSTLKIETLESEKEKIAYDLARQKLILIFSIAFALVLTLLFIIIYKSQKQKHRLLQQAKEIEVVKSRIAGQEEERSRIARELHDGIAADLTGVRINLANLKFEPNEPFPIKNIVTQITNIGNEIRTISHNLASPTFTDTTLEEAIESFILQIKGKTELHIKLNVYPKVNWSAIDYHIQKEVYRIFQEIVNNTVKYSFASELSMQIVKHQTHLSVVFEDNGKGFTESETEGIGLNNIRKRIQLMNGEIEISSSKGKGCSIAIEVPLIPTPKFALS
jgi:two-component system, NarL family, sensor kinase